jgi:hypothetical protein
MRFLKGTSVFGFGLLFLFAVAAPGRAQLILSLPLSSQPAGQPAYDMVLDVPPGTGGWSIPLNPFLHATAQNPTGAMSVMTAAGLGVQFDTISTTYAACSCIRIGTSLPLVDPTTGNRLIVNMAANSPRLQGYAAFQTDPTDLLSVPSFGVELVNDGIVQQSILLTAETPYYPAVVPANNCATAFNLTTFIFPGSQTSGMFDVPLASIPGVRNITFDEIKVYLMGYGCGPTQGATTTVGGLQLAY